MHTCIRKGRCNVFLLLFPDMNTTSYTWYFAKPYMHVYDDLNFMSCVDKRNRT